MTNSPNFCNRTDAFINESCMGSNNDNLTIDYISEAINLYVPPVMIILGCAFNVLIILVMRTKLFHSLSTSVYLTAGAVNDFSSLLISLIPHWLYINFPEAIIRTDYSHYMCKFFNFYGWGNTDFGILVISAVTTDRAIAIMRPLQAVKNCTASRARKILILLLFITVAKQLHFIFASDIVPAGRNERLCDIVPPNETYKIFYFRVWPWIHIGFLSVNFLIIIVSNVILINNVKHSANRRTSGQQKMRQIAPLIIGESVLIIVLTFPFSIHIAVLAYSISYGDNVYSDPETKATETLIFSITFYMLYSNKVVTFSMYCLAGTRFRDGLKRLFYKNKMRKSERQKTIHLSSCLVSSPKPETTPYSTSTESFSIHM